MAGDFEIRRAAKCADCHDVEATHITRDLVAMTSVELCEDCYWRRHGRRPVVLGPAVAGNGWSTAWEPPPGPACEKAPQMPRDARGYVRVLYMAHPVSGDVAGNVARAKRWYRWLSAHVAPHTLICPWLLDLELLPLRDDVPEDRANGLRKCEAVAAVCAGVVLVGGRISEGMRREAEACRTRLVHDMTILGDLPPDGEG